jgi:hypothetical protein
MEGGLKFHGFQVFGPFSAGLALSPLVLELSAD